MEKHQGGRGKKSENKYERFTASVPPHILAALDVRAEARGISRSEVLVLAVELLEKMRPLKKRV